jgi:endonuclease/exonuclease/phosphatase family metal-dependent hydrolase
VFVHDTPTHWTVADSTVTVNDGAWHHLVGQFDSSNGTLKLYIDGVQKASATAPGIVFATGIHDLFIGHHGNGSTLYDFNGRLDHIRLYSRALTDADISALNAEAPKILTWNLRKGRATDNSDSINGAGNTVSSFVKYIGADVLLLSATETLQEATDIKNQLGGTWSVDWHKSSNSHEGQAILSRFDMPNTGLSDRDVFEVTQGVCGGTENQVIVFDTVVINSVRYAFFAIDQQDGSANGSVRSCQAGKFRDWITSKNAAEPRIVAGDFNTDSDAGLTNWTSPADGYFDGWPTGLKKFGYAAEGSSQGNTTGRTKKTALDHILYSKASGVTAEAAQVWDTRFLYPGTTCGNITSDSFLSVCSVPCTSCAYVDDKSVRPSDHIPFTLIVSR